MRWTHHVPPALLAVALFLIVAGGKLAVLGRFDSDLPWWDAWDGIGAAVLVPAEKGELTPANVLAPHNEHRIVWTRLLDLALLQANGWWDARLESVVNALLHAGLVAGIFLAARGILTPLAWAGWFGVLAVFTAPPVVWENVIRSFDSQHYFLIGFSIAAIGLLLAGAPGSGRWWAGVAGAVGALFAMGSGLVAAAVVAVTLLLGTPRKTWWSRHRWTLLACGCVVAAGWLLRRDVPAHADYRAHDLSEFATAFWHHLQWPLVHLPWFGAMSWLPWLGLVAVGIGRPERRDRAGLILFAVGLWALAHYAAMAYMRGSLQPWPPVRGLENVVVGLGVNALILLRALSVWRAPARFLRPLRAGAVMWAAFVLFGLLGIVRENQTIVLPQLAAQMKRAEALVRDFVATGDRDDFQGPDMPHPNFPALAGFLSDPAMRAILPPSVRLDPVERTRPPAGSRLAVSLTRLGTPFVFGGALLGVLAWLWYWRRGLFRDQAGGPGARERASAGREASP